MIVAFACVAACGRYGFEDGDAGGSDARDGDAANDLPHITPAAGWSVRVFNDFSAQHTFRPTDFVDGAETYHNSPDSMFILRSPYPEALAIVAGRELIELTGQGYVPRDFGAHPPNTPNLPDYIRCGVWTRTLNAGNPQILVSSSSDLGGDGTYTISTQWVSSQDVSTNNTRCVAWDDTGSFDNTGVPEAYLANSGGVMRRSTATTIITGDTKTLMVVADTLLLTRTITIDTDVRLIRVGSMNLGAYPETELVRRTFIELGEGIPPAPGIAWGLLETEQLVAIDASGGFDVIAESLDPAFNFQAAVTPPVGHALATSPSIVYVLETNRALDIDRILVLTSP